jgi:hypothetical protein
MQIKNLCSLYPAPNVPALLWEGKCCDYCFGWCRKLAVDWCNQQTETVDAGYEIRTPRGWEPTLVFSPVQKAGIVPSTRRAILKGTKQMSRRMVRWSCLNESCMSCGVTTNSTVVPPATNLNTAAMFVVSSSIGSGQRFADVSEMMEKWKSLTSTSNINL